MICELDAGKKIIWILGLNHAGTTIVWRAFRKNPELLCFDEPLSGDVGVWFPENNSKRTFNEYIKIFGENPKQFWDVFAPIEPLQELDSSFSSEHVRYLTILIASKANVVIDETHLHLHLPALFEISPKANIVHLYRRASAFATSHMRPSWSMDTTLPRYAVRWLKHQYNRFMFWERQDILPDMRRGDVIGSHPKSKFGLMLTDAGYDAERIMASPALVRLLAYWHYHYHYLEREGPRLFGERFRSLRYEDFASHPQETMMQLYQWLGMAVPKGVTYSDVHLPKPPFRANDSRWREAAKIAGFSEEELETLL